jgi:hypothetical protein
MEPPKFLVCFNFPDPKLPTGRRDVTNVPTQALALMNDPFVNAQAEFWANRLVAAPQGSVDARLQEMFLAALGREPAPQELKRWKDFVEASAGDTQSTQAALLRCREAWKQVAHLLFNAKEFLYYR